MEVTMKTNLSSAVATLSLVVLASTRALGISGSIQAEIPFAFVVGDAVLPPAGYIIDIAGGTGPSVLSIRTMESGHRVMFDTLQIPEKANPRSLELVFDTVGDTTYLTEVWGVTDSGRAVKHQPIPRVPGASRRHVTAVRVVAERGKKD
jgi:hypothetical protein